jgi:hypothetical protein
MKVSLRVQCIIVEVSSLVSIIIVTLLSVIVIQQLIGIFYAATLNAVLITAIIVVAARWVHALFVAS